MVILGRTEKIVEWHGRRGHPVVHLDKQGKKYIMVRKEGGGTKRLYGFEKHYVDVKRKMARRGLPKAIAKKYGISKKAWRVYRSEKRGKSKSKSKSSKSRRRSNPTNTRRKARSVTVPLMIVLPIAGTLMWSHTMHPKLEGKINLFIKAYTGFDPGLGTWNSGWLKNGLYPLILGAALHKFVGGAPLHLNRALGRAKIPFIRL